MRAFASSFHAWKSLERQEGIKVPHGLVFPLAVVEAIGRPHGLKLVAEETTDENPLDFDAIFVSVLDSRCMIDAAKHFRKWKLPFRRAERSIAHPMVWAGGQGLHNPLPMADVADLIVIGDAESPVPRLLQLFDLHSTRMAFLEEAAGVEGVFVPSVHDRKRDTIKQSVAIDISTTLNSDISVSLDGSRRLEIARGCKYKCTFCSLGWRTPVRENSPEAVITQIRRSPKRVHLQAGDAESHSGINAIRASLREHGGMDQGWTGRLDTLFENPDQTIPGQKRYAFGVEGASYRLRRAVGKGFLTDDRLVEDTCRFFDSIEGNGKGRAAWHLIAGLPASSTRDAIDLVRVIMQINERRRGKIPRNLSLHWQPFQPLPGTPMQWCAAGTGARSMLSRLRAVEGLPWVPVRQVGGRTDPMALLCSVLARSDERGSRLLEAIASGTVTIEKAEAISGSTAGTLDPAKPLPWDFIESSLPRATLERAYAVMMQRLADGREP